MNQLRDQSAHLAAAVAGILPCALWGPGVATLAWATFCMGLVREVTEEGTPVTPGKVVYAIAHSKLDLAFWTAGGVLVGVVVG
jgi:hypothetical protein